ncbi:3-oxo-tetronate kinase [Bordetella bronchialis]|uniref:3-oxo-tetronate kinase n=1 Tax=Bordetella bronchialis TaxID=463025 RepID=A0A193FTI4_9BORD|nr:3-oxo-tetronate kinase [Bordetella bronchialis]ANN70950.1 hypothetical protein BAU08_06035 [Bordetella bronchialis]
MIRLGCIADDFTGATDLANNLVRGGMRTLQVIGVPDAAAADGVRDMDAVVVALKSRTTPAEDAVEQSLRALRWLRAQGASQIYFKYCSTFDSTPRGNIGPVAEALMDALGTDFTVATPAFPDNGRTVFKGHLFVGDVLLHESGMRDHPLTPMTDANLVRVLQAQSRRQVGLIDYRAVAAGAPAVRARIDALRAAGVGMAIVDAVSNGDLLRLGEAVRDLPLVTGGSGLALGLPANFGLRPSPTAERLPPAQGMRAIVSGSCSQATLRQVRHYIDAGGAAMAVDPARLAQGAEASAADASAAEAQRVLEWARPRLADGPVLVYSSASPEAVRQTQDILGAEQAGARVESVLAQVARGLAQAGVRQMIVAGGETSGACVQALGLSQLQIGPQIDPGVPWCHARGNGASGPGLHVALKSGNFGGDDFFSRAYAVLDAGIDHREAPEPRRGTRETGC